MNYASGAYAFWKDMLDGKFPEYPTQVLIAMNFTLGDLIAGKLEKS